MHYIFYFFLLFLVPLYGYQAEDVYLKIAQAAEEQVGVTTMYAPGYVRISYPGGDIPLEKGVCTDVIIRALREIGIDLQKEVHEDMAGHFKAYPKFWKMKAPDANIDHRRVPNLMKFFQRRGKSVRTGSEYMPGDIIAWELDNGLFHIGIVSTEIVQGTKRYYMIHNIGAGAKKEDMLYDFKIIGHYRW
ncbi:MAG: DUF1287 domain-containing protein [Bacteroidetes bacterium]|nr:DUF1287 domain-containing protein [Bacteroidota bacterium]